MIIYCVVGEQCKDVFLYGSCERFSPEAPVPVFRPVDEVVNIGMAGNVISNLRAIIDKYGDMTAEFVTSVLSEDRIKKTRYVDKKSNHIFLRVDEYDSVRVMEPYNIGNINADAVLISDYNKGFLSDELIVQFKKKLPDCTIFLDTKREMTQDLLLAVDFVKLNEPEYDKVDERLKIVFEHKFIVTLGSNGAMYGKKKYPSKRPIQTTDVSGAGDTFFAALVFSYMNNKSISKSISFANDMASIVVSKRGVSTI